MDTSHNTQSQRPYSIESYNPEWPKRFEEIHKVLTRIWGAKTLAIEHVGSTSVPGMSAKPCIDVLVVIDKLADYTDEIKAMLQEGYEQQMVDVEEDSVLRDELWFYKTASDGRKIENIHFRLSGSKSERSILLGRDYLRAHSDRVREYNKLKSELITKFPNNYFAYREGKQNFMQETQRLAEEWDRERRQC